MNKIIDLAFSPCPNDTFIFHAMLHRLINIKDYIFKPNIHDVEYLNKKAFKNIFTITKLSFHTYLHVKDKYSILNSGSALGYGCGPILISTNSDKKIEDMKIAIPGEYTTAYMLLKLWNPEIKNVIPVRFDNIITGVNTGEYDAGLIIHEGRFIFHEFGLTSIIDLGQWWEQETGLPIPLGCIVIKKDIDQKTVDDINYILKSSVEYALQNRNASKKYIKQYAQEMDDNIINEHINLYVNDFTIDLGTEGREAINKLEEMAKWKKII